MKYEMFQQQICSCKNCPFLGYISDKDYQSYCNHIKSPESLMDLGSLDLYVKNNIIPGECPLRHTSVLIYYKE